MKSSAKVYRHSSQKEFAPWNPLELGGEESISPSDTQKVQVMDILGNVVESSSSNISTKTTVLKRGNNLNFNTWLPGEMRHEKFASHSAKWIFFGPSRVTSHTIEQTQPFKFDEFENLLCNNQSAFETEAAMILKQAQIKADELILKAQNEVEKIHLHAQQELEEQSKNVYQQCQEQVLSEIGEALKAAQAIVEEIEIWKTEFLANGEPILINMLKEISQKMFGEGAVLNDTALQSNLNRIMENAHNLGEINIFLNPEDAKTLNPSWKDYQMLVSGDRVKIIPSEKIIQGGCFISGNMGSVDGRVETQLKSILATFD